MRTITALRALFAFSTLGLLAELLLTRHWADVWQVVPLVLLVAGLAILFTGNVRAAQGIMALLLAAGLAGIGLHYKAKLEFALERNRALSGWALVTESIKGTSPPILAPGAMIALGLLGLIVVARHHTGEEP